MKKILTSLLALMTMAATFTACESSTDGEGSTSSLSQNENGSLVIGTDSLTISMGTSTKVNLECSFEPASAATKFIAIQATVIVNGAEIAQALNTRSTTNAWSVAVTNADYTNGTFTIILNSPIGSTLRLAPAMLKVVATSSLGEEITAFRSINCEEISVGGIPDDDDAGETPQIEENTVVIPDIASEVIKDPETGCNFVNISITGIPDGNGGYIELTGTGSLTQNVWIEFNNNPKGVLIEKVTSSTRTKNDIIFLVDNSGSMSQEADSIASSIQKWATELYNAGIDAQFACVGYDDYGNVSGALDLTGSTEISDYLNRYSGTSRTEGFLDNNLETAADEIAYKNASDECGVVALRFANDKLSFRSGANRVYVNFTDEPNQTNYEANNSVEWVNDISWSGKGTIHTIYSGHSCSTSYDNEDPRLLSTYTGGTTMDVDSNFENVTLSSLPVSDAIQNSYIIKFTNIDEFIGTSQTYELKIVVKDGVVQSEKIAIIEL